MHKALPTFTLSVALLLCLIATPIHADEAQDLLANVTLTSRACQTDLGVDNVRLYATSPGGPFPSTSDSQCLAACPSSLGWLGSTRQVSTGSCWCIRQPFGSPASGVYRTDFHSNFNPNAPTYGCQSWTVADQKWMFSPYSGTAGPFIRNSAAACAGYCSQRARPAWTRQRSTNRCWCGTGTAFLSNALLYDTDFDAGVVSPS